MTTWTFLIREWKDCQTLLLLFILFIFFLLRINAWTGDRIIEFFFFSLSFAIHRRFFFASFIISWLLWREFDTKSDGSQVHAIRKCKLSGLTWCTCKTMKNFYDWRTNEQNEKQFDCLNKISWMHSLMWINKNVRWKFIGQQPSNSIQRRREKKTSVKIKQ